MSHSDTQQIFFNDPSEVHRVFEPLEQRRIPIVQVFAAAGVASDDRRLFDFLRDVRTCPPHVMEKAREMLAESHEKDECRWRHQLFDAVLELTDAQGNRPFPHIRFIFEQALADKKTAAEAVRVFLEDVRTCPAEVVDFCRRALERPGA